MLIYFIHLDNVFQASLPPDVSLLSLSLVIPNCYSKLVCTPQSNTQLLLLNFLPNVSLYDRFIQFCFPPFSAPIQFWLCSLYFLGLLLTNFRSYCYFFFKSQYTYTLSTHSLCLTPCYITFVYKIEYLFERQENGERGRDRQSEL